MTSIDPAGTMLAYLREQVQALRPPAPAGVAQQSGASHAHAELPQDCSAQLARSISTIDHNDPQARRKAFRVYLKSVLLQEFGSALAADPGFATLVDRVRDTMEGTPGLKESMDQAGALLLERFKAS